MKKFALFCFLLLVSLSVLSAGPFGIMMGQSLDSLIKNELGPELLEGTSDFYLVNPKISHPLLKYVGVTIGEDGCVNRISAQSSTIRDFGYGESLRLAFSDIKNLIDCILGPSELIDYIKPDSTLANPEDWLESIAHEDRYYFALWSDSSGASLPVDIGQIGITIVGLTDFAGYISMEFMKAESELF